MAYSDVTSYTVVGLPEIDVFYRLDHNYTILLQTRKWLAHNCSTKSMIPKLQPSLQSLVIVIIESSARTITTYKILGFNLTFPFSHTNQEIYKLIALTKLMILLT